MVTRPNIRSRCVADTADYGGDMSTPAKKPANPTAAAKKATAKKASAKKTTATKAPAKKATAKKTGTAAKKARAKKAPAKPPATKAPTSTAGSDARATTKPRPVHDIVVFGATGFTGRLVAAYLAREAPSRLRVALAGRSEGKLGQIRQDLGGRGKDFPLVIANSRDEQSLKAMAADTRALITTVGPYAKYGLPVVAACAAAGTNYCDLTGEVLFMRDSIERYDSLARRNKARIVHSCGFDSIPSDLGVLALARAAAADDPEARLLETRFIVTGMKGGISGGTIASGLNEVDRAKEDSRASTVLADPYSLSPDRAGEPTPGDGSDPRGVVHDEILDVWLAPFLMGPINSRVVRRSNALSDWSYGRRFQYAEYLSTGGGLTGRLAATGVALGMAIGEAAMSVPAVRSLAERVLPEPGDGPGDEARAKGYFSIALHTRSTSGVPYSAKVAAKGDPGYAATAMMLATTGMTLAGDGLPRSYGVLTPATAMGELLITNLKLAGMTIQAGRM